MDQADSECARRACSTFWAWESAAVRSAIIGFVISAVFLAALVAAGVPSSSALARSRVSAAAAAAEMAMAMALLWRASSLDRP